MEETQTINFFDGRNIHGAFQKYTVMNLNTICKRFLLTVRGKSRMEMYEIIAQAPPSIQEKIREEVVYSPQKHGQSPSWMAMAIDSQQEMGGPTVSTSHASNDSGISNADHQLSEGESFMKAPSKEVIDGVIADFIDRTGNCAMDGGVCAACAHETIKKDLKQFNLNHIPNSHRLRPSTPHPAHDIYNGMLFQPAGVMSHEIANICSDCTRALNSDKTPSLSLANGMWIGATPHELAYLTLPERLLIAKYFPAAYIIKLYPKKKGARHWDSRQMYNGLKGNVSTYQLDQGQIASMIDGTILPQQPKILAATIGITFVGPRNLPDRSLPDIFRIRRTHVRRALEWLKDNNPLFSNITISASRLAELPENDIPYELRVTTKLSSDVDKLHAEQDGYVPVQEACDEEEDEGKFGLSAVYSKLNTISQTWARVTATIWTMMWIQCPQSPQFYL